MNFQTNSKPFSFKLAGIITLMSGLILALFTNSFASPEGGLAGPVEERNFTFLSGIGYTLREVDHNSDIKSFQFKIKPNYGISDQFDVFLDFGFRDLGIENKEDDTRNFSSTLGLLVGAGAKLSFFKPKEQKTNLVLNMSLDYSEVSSDLAKATVVEYRAAVIFTYKMENITPYGGVKFSGINIDYSKPGDNNTKDTERYNSPRNIGFLGGLDYFVNPNVYFSGELNIFDQQALFMSVGYKF
jgi:hypothetical protein